MTDSTPKLSRYSHAPPGPDVAREGPVVAVLRYRLRQSMYVSLREIECDLQGGVLTMRGVVPRFYLKQVLLSLAEDFDEVERIVDEVEVYDEELDDRFATRARFGK